MKRVHWVSYGIAILSLGGIDLALAQYTNPGGAAPNSIQADGAVSPTGANNTDQLFVRQFFYAGTIEVEFAQFARQRSMTASVQALQQRLIEDHSKANQLLAAIAQHLGTAVPPIPASTKDPDHEVMRASLEQLQGKQFETAYLRGQVTDHQSAAQLLEWEVDSGQNESLRAFAKQTLPIILHHLQMVRESLAQLAGAS
jgi:putative membrane protein